MKEKKVVSVLVEVFVREDDLFAGERLVQEVLMDERITDIRIDWNKTKFAEEVR